MRKFSNIEYFNFLFSFLDLKIASTAVWETFDVAVFFHRMDIIDIYSCSFANFHTGTKTYKLEKNQEDAFIKGTTLVIISPLKNFI